MVKRKKNIEFSGSLDFYLRQIRQIPLLAREEERSIALRIRAGDDKAFKELVRRNLRYVVTVSNMYRGCGLSLDDLISEGNIGLIQAARKFDPDRGVKFITYAVWWIRQAIVHALAEQAGTVRLPIKQAGLIFKIHKEFKRFFQANDKDPTLEELAVKLRMTVEDIATIMRVYRRYLSLNTPLGDDGETSYLDLVTSENRPSVEEDVLKAALSEGVEEIMEEISPRENAILRRRFGFEGHPQTLEEIGKVMNLSRERIRQIEYQAKSKLKSRPKVKALHNYLN